MKQTLTIVSLPRANMENALMARTCSLAHVTLDTPAFYANLKLTNVNRILANLEAFAKI